MAYSFRLQALTVATLVIGCQRLPGSEDSTSTSGNDPDDTGAATFLMTSDTGAFDGDDDGGPALECDPVAQTGCAEDEKCTPILSGGVRDRYTCVADPGGLEVFGVCSSVPSSGIDGCPAGWVCLENDASDGLCVPLCLKNSDCDQALCIEDPVEDVPFCADECSPFESLCSSPLQCRRLDDRFVCKFAAETDVGGYGDECSLDQDQGCGPGFACLPGALIPGCSATNCCTNLCDLSGTDPCTPPATCNGVIDGPAPGFEFIGACFVPA